MACDLLILAFPQIDHEKDYVYSWMPYSVLAVAKPLLDEDLCDVVMFDGNEQPTAEWEALLDEHLERALCVGFSVMTGGGQIAHALKLADMVRARAPRVPLVWGGPHVNVLPEQTLEHPHVDIVLQGPGQRSMPALVRALSRGEPLDAVPGLRAKRPVVRGPVNLPETDVLSRYPWQLIDLARYLRDDPTVSGRTLNYVSSQGCAYTCRFCYELVYERRWSAIGAGDLLDDVEHLMRSMAVTGIKFYDADFFINLNRAEAFCDGLIDRRLALRWAASINPRDILRARARRPHLLATMAESGCGRLLMGVESGSDRVLAEIVDKRVTRADVLDVARSIAEVGILGSYTFIVGFPGETDAEQEETYSLIDELRGLDPVPETRVHVFAPYPGTPLFEEARRCGYEPPSSFAAWSSYDYYDSQTPWTDARTVERARQHTRMTLAPSGTR
ncbi:MAG: B12-binding domain-containing radical SAM protein [Solirubrobacteraceae bacterium]